MVGRCGYHRPVFTGRPGTREVLVRYALAIARTGLVHRVLASRRWSGGDKADALALLGMLFSVTLFPALVACVLWWLLLGRGPVRWAGTARCVVVNPFRQPGRRGRLP